jgi:glycosyltransferase 2 family protein
MSRWRDVKPAIFAVAPTVTAMLTLGAGVMLLASGTTPAAEGRLAWLALYVPLTIIEIAHFASSILGLVLVLVAFGLRKKLDGAWAVATCLLAVSAGLALVKGLNWEETAVLMAICLALLPLRPAFTRTARLSQLEFTPGWVMSAFAAVVGSGILGLWSFHHVEFSGQLWWQMMVSADASRALRGWTGVGLVFLVFGLWRLVGTAATPRIVGDQDPDFARVRAILAKAEHSGPEANLALLGDKRFLFSQSGDSFLMFGVRGRSWVAMGPPVGQPSERLELLWRFRELADSHACRPAVYNFGPDLLPEIVELGFAIQKTGESAKVLLEGFSLQGRRREVLRRNWRKAAEAGATFEVIGAGEAGPLLDELKAISDAWLDTHAGGEKGFSLGRFEAAYVCEFPLALVRSEGRLVAFANLWTTPDCSAFSMDLMRYREGGPKNIMDFLFVELLAWGRAQGYTAFDFGVAPLAGLDKRPLAPFMTRVGRLLFERGEDIYNFQGVRRYKDKYDPIWRPRYVAAANKWAIPVILADVGLMSSGGVSGLTKRPRKEGAAGDLPKAA